MQQLSQEKLRFLDYSVVLVTQSRPTFCNSMDCSPPGSSVLGILWERILKWVVITFCRGSSQLRDRTWSPELQADTLLSKYLGVELWGHMKEVAFSSVQSLSHVQIFVTP